MSLEARIRALAEEVGKDIKQLSTTVENLNPSNPGRVVEPVSVFNNGNPELVFLSAGEVVVSEVS